MIGRLLPALAALAGVVMAGSAACAHPHVWVTVKSDLVYAPDGSVTGVQHAWTFDDMFSTFALQGLEGKKKGEFTREELAPLATVNVDSLKEYDFFTYAKANDKAVEFNEPQAGYYLEYDPKDTVLTLHFTRTSICRSCIFRCAYAPNSAESSGRTTGPGCTRTTRTWAGLRLG